MNTSDSSSNLAIDIIIIGGGIAGLWALNLARSRGYSALLLEQDTLGGKQTLASQGILHSGLKYNLDGNVSKRSQSLCSMPSRWRDCLEGTGQIDLRAVDQLSDQCYLWSDQSAGGALTTTLASKLLASGARRLQRDEYPTAFQNDQFKGPVYHLDETVLDVSSLIQALTKNHRDCIRKVDWQNAKLSLNDGAAVLSIGGLSIHPKQLLLCAGTGNAALLRQLGKHQPAMQQRPLQQLLVRPPTALGHLFGHCVGKGSSPRLTVTSHGWNGDPIWYLGGQLANDGAEQPAEVLIDQGRAHMQSLFPWINWAQTEWATLAIDRAEPQLPNGQRADDTYVAPVEGVNNTKVIWPLKLTLCPAMGDRLIEDWKQTLDTPRTRSDLPSLAPLDHLQDVPLGTPPWQTMFSHRRPLSEERQ